MGSLGGLNGYYLIAEKNPIFTGTPEIYLMLNKGERVQILCVNQFLINDLGQVRTGAEFLPIFEESGTANCMQYLRDLPLLRGGPNNLDQIQVLHTGYENAAGATEFIKNIYYLSSLEDFASSISENSNPAFSIIIVGNYDPDPMTLTLATVAGSWDFRYGLHWMAYGHNLDRKIGYADRLIIPQEKKTKDGKFNIGGLLGQIKLMVDEAAPSLMAMSIYAHLKSTTEMSLEEIKQATRTMIAVSDKEACSVTDIMKKYTHQEWTQEYENLTGTGFEFKLLNEYDRRQEMLLDLGLTPIFYDSHVAQKISHSRTQQEGPQKPLSGRSRLLVKTLSGLAKLIMARRKV